MSWVKDCKGRRHFIADRTKPVVSKDKATRKAKTKIVLEDNAFYDGGEKESGGHLDSDGNFIEDF